MEETMREERDKVGERKAETQEKSLYAKNISDSNLSFFYSRRFTKTFVKIGKLFYPCNCAILYKTSSLFKSILDKIKNIPLREIHLLPDEVINERVFQHVWNYFNTLVYHGKISKTEKLEGLKYMNYLGCREGAMNIYLNSLLFKFPDTDEGKEVYSKLLEMEVNNELPKEWIQKHFSGHKKDYEYIILDGFTNKKEYLKKMDMGDALKRLGKVCEKMQNEPSIEAQNRRELRIHRENDEQRLRLLTREQQEREVVQRFEDFISRFPSGGGGITPQ